MVAACEAVHDAERVAQHVGTGIDQARGGERGAEVPEKGSVDPTAFDEIELRRDAEAARELDTQEDGFAELLTAHFAARARCGERRWYRRGAGVKDRFVVRVVESDTRASPLASVKAVFALKLPLSTVKFTAAS